MNISKISRSIVVVGFVALLLFMYIIGFGVNNSSQIKIFEKLLYIVASICVLALYIYLKNKLYKLKIDKKIALVYRYAYIAIMVILFKIFELKDILANGKYVFYVFGLIILNIVISIVIKKIIFNISKSDILSVLGIIIYIALPINVLDKSIYLVSLISTLCLCLSLIFMQKLIDELKQQGIKNKKYILFALLFSVFSAFCIVLGLNIYIYLISLLLLFLITCNLDRTHVNFSNRLLNKIDKNTKDKLYKIERININKLFIAVILIIFFVFALVFLFTLSINHISIINKLNINLESSFVNYFSISNFDFNLQNIIANVKGFISYSKYYTLILFTYIIFIEILTFILKRRYDTKSTYIKLIFILIFLAYSTLNLDIYYFKNIFYCMLDIIAIINTSNIYLNREERIKLLKAVN